MRLGRKRDRLSRAPARAGHRTTAWAAVLGGVAGAMLLAQACSFPDIQIDPGSGGAGGSASSAGGGLPECDSEAQCPLSPTECAHASCINSACGFVNEVPRTACGAGGTKLCNGMGECLECLAADDCGVNMLCESDTCISMACSNDILDGEETGKDCGGPDCAPCTNMGGCTTGADCLSGFCEGGAGGGGGGAGTCKDCVTNEDCSGVTGTYCELKVCVPKKAPGVACNDSAQCLSESCPDEDVCCEGPCAGACKSCNALHTGSSPGVCGDVPAGKDPYEECVLQCNGNGGCVIL